VVISAELPAVVAATHEVSLTASVAIMLTSITRSVTVPLSLPTGLLRSTTSPATKIVSPRTPLAWFRLKGDESVRV